jgi:hypothetical protein
VAAPSHLSFPSLHISTFFVFAKARQPDICSLLLRADCVIVLQSRLMNSTNTINLCWKQVFIIVLVFASYVSGADFRATRFNVFTVGEFPGMFLCRMDTHFGLAAIHTPTHTYAPKNIITSAHQHPFSGGEVQHLLPNLGRILRSGVICIVSLLSQVARET